MRTTVAFLAGAAALAGLGLAGASRSTLSANAVLADDHAHHGMEMDAAGATKSHTISHSAAGASVAQQAGGIPPNAADAPARIAASPRRGEWKIIKVGATDSVIAWVVHPQRTTKAPVVIVIHDNTGLSTWARSVADQLAADGFIAIAPELLTMRRKGDLTAEWSADSARAVIGSITADDVTRSLEAVAKFGMALPNALPKYGVVGFCWGGGHSFLHAVRSPAVSAAVVYYGTPPAGNQLASISAPVLGLYGGADARVTSTVPSTDSAMKRLGKTYEAHVFDGAAHGFLKGQEAGGGPNVNASKQGWPMTVAWFKKYLGA